MDGAIILASDGTRVARANVHLVPDPDIPTNETGTRHRTAERVARQISVPVITVSEEMGVVSVHYQGNKQTLDRIPRVLARADQALQILGRYKSRLDGVTALSLEVEDPDGPRRRHRAAARRWSAGSRRRSRGTPSSSDSMGGSSSSSWKS
jgi:diadenylate cyclase